jgi:hypothetical protein
VFRSGSPAIHADERILNPGFAADLAATLTASGLARVSSVFICWTVPACMAVEEVRSGAAFSRTTLATLSRNVKQRVLCSVMPRRARNLSNGEEITRLPNRHSPSRPADTLAGKIRKLVRITVVNRVE